MKGTSTKAAGAYNFEARPKANGKRKYRKDAEEAQPANQRATEEHYYESQAVRYEPLETPPTDSSVQPLYFYLDRPETPVYVPLPPGVDKCTQIPRYDWNLHDYDIEVEPILQSLVGRCLEQSRIELIEDYEQEQYKLKRKQFEIKRNAELMKTQRLDAEFRRLEQEQERRQLQRNLHYDNKKSTHQKLYSRVLAKNFLEGIESMAFKALLIEGYFKDEVEQQVEGSLYDWLIDQTVAQGGRQQRIQEAVHKMEKGVESEYVGLHRAYLQREAERLRKIVEEKDRVQREFEEAREARRERRRQLRVSRTKRKFLEEIDAQVYSKRTVEPEVFSLKVVALTDQDSQVKKFRTYGGLFFEWWVLFSFCRNTLHKKVEGAFEKFLLEDDVKKLFLGFLSDVVIKEGSIRVNINKKYKSDFEEALEQMNSNLLAFNQTKEEMITKFVAKEDLLVGVAIQHVIKLHILDQNIYEALLKNLLRIYFKSNDYKIEDTVVEKVSGQEAVGEATEQIVGGSDQNTEGQTAANKGDDIQDPKAQSEKGSSHKAPEIKKQVLPEITEEDRKIEQLKKKLDINFLEEEETLPSRFDGVFRIKESINRDEVNPRARALSESKLQAEQGEVSADPFLDVKMHGRSYLLEKHLGKLRETEEEKARQREAEKQQRKDRYIEQYLGDTYERDLDRHSLEDMERPATNLLEATELSGGRKVLFLHQINQLLFRLAMLEKMKDYFTKEMFFLKDSNINEMIRPIDKELETLITPMLVHTDRNLTPIYDKES